jgi:hypothetical protein
MSSASKKAINQSEIDYLALDFGLYPGSKDLRNSLLARQNSNNNITIMDLNTKLMSTAEWDSVIDNILKAKRCITL